MAQQVWFITGSSTGFGRETAIQALEAGHLVAASARTPDSLSDLVATYGDRVITPQLDVTDFARIDAVVAEIIAKWGRIDVLMNNAGYSQMGGIEDPSWEQIRAQFETNFFGAAAVLRAVLPSMRERGSGRILNISSIVGLVSYMGGGWYASTKHALEALNESLALEAGPLGIKVTSIQPGPFRTDFAGRSIRLPATRTPGYEETVGVRLDKVKDWDGNQIGDPVRAAKLMVEVAAAENPPLRLPLGQFAHDEVQLYIESLQKDIGDWKDKLIATDFPS